VDNDKLEPTRTPQNVTLSLALVRPGMTFVTLFGRTNKNEKNRVSRTYANGCNQPPSRACRGAVLGIPGSEIGLLNRSLRWAQVDVPDLNKGASMLTWHEALDLRVLRGAASTYDGVFAWCLRPSTTQY
jgi:hypothetical protein